MGDRATNEVAERVKKLLTGVSGWTPAESLTTRASEMTWQPRASIRSTWLLGFEEEFGCEIPDAAASTILTVGDAVSSIEKQAA
jgi:acyl carrier protein